MRLPGKQNNVTRQIYATCPLSAPRWMWLAMPDDTAQCLALAELLHPHRPEAAQAEANYLLRELARTQWRSGVARPQRRPAICRPSKSTISGYRADSSRKQEARLKLSPERRSEIAKIAAAKRWRKEEA